MSKKKIYIPVIPVGPETEPAWWTTPDTITKPGEQVPVYFEDMKSAMIHLINENINHLQEQINKIESGDIAPEDAELECDEEIVEALIDEAGVITYLDGEEEGIEIYNPKTFVR